MDHKAPKKNNDRCHQAAAACEGCRGRSRGTRAPFGMIMTPSVPAICSQLPCTSSASSAAVTSASGPQPKCAPPLIAFAAWPTIAFAECWTVRRGGSHLGGPDRHWAARGATRR